MRDAAAVRRILEVSDSAAGLRSAIRDVTESLHSPAAAEIRSLRTWTIAQSMVRPTLKEMLAQPQDEILDAMIGIIVTAQERGWVRPELDSRSTAIFIFSYSYGSSLGDLASVPMDRAAYVDLIMDVLDRAVFADHALD